MSHLSTKNILTQKLKEEFSPLHLSVIDDSAKHASHAGAIESGGGHYVIILVSKAFDGLVTVDRHRTINNLLEHEFAQNDIHALSLKIFTPLEWQNAAK